MHQRRQHQQGMALMLKQPVVTALFVLAVLFVILRTVLLSIPQIFSGGAALGKVYT